MSGIRLSFVALVATSVSMFAACGGGDDDAAPGTPTPVSTDFGEPTVESGDPEVLARQMVAAYVTMTGEMVALLDQDLAPEELAPEIAALKSKYIDIFVAMGYQREAFAADEIAAFNQKATVELFSLEFDHQDMVNELLSELNAAGENDLASEITSLNILTQYAQFELLWDQEPDEAERLALPSPAHPR